MTRLAMMRHGRTSWNRAGQIQGRRDIPLDPEAVVELSNYQLPSSWRNAILVSSPLSRAIQTAQLIGGRAPDINDALIEMDWGEWEGQRNVDLYADASSGFRHIEDWGWDYCPPGGESPSDVRARLEPWVQSLRQDTVAVCHIGVMRTLLATAHGWHFNCPAPFEIKRNRLYVLEVADKLRIATPACERLVGHGRA